MRLTIALLLLALLMYLAGSTIVAAHTMPVTRSWHGEGNGGLIRFSLPAGPLPGVMSKRRTLRYRLACTGLKAGADMPPNTHLQATFSLSLTGAPGDTVLSTSDNRGSGVRSIGFADGGTYDMSIGARPTCAWRVDARSG